MHTLSLSLARTSFVESLMSGGTERRQCETCCENRPFFLSLSLSPAFFFSLSPPPPLSFLFTTSFLRTRGKSRLQLFCRARGERYLRYDITMKHGRE